MVVDFRTHKLFPFTAHGRSHCAGDSVGGLSIRGKAGREDNPGHSGEYALVIFCCTVSELCSARIQWKLSPYHGTNEMWPNPFAVIN